MTPQFPNRHDLVVDVAAGTYSPNRRSGYFVNRASGGALDRGEIMATGDACPAYATRHRLSVVFVTKLGTVFCIREIAGG
jgi:hypothetical protein